MLYLLHTDGSIHRLPSAVSAEIDETDDCLVCRDAEGAEITRIPRLEISMFSTKPLIMEEAAPGAVPTGRSTDLVRAYLEARDTMLARIGPVTGEMDQWTERHSQVPATLSDVAQLEGLRAQRARLLAEFEDFESEFIAELLKSLVADRAETRREEH